jgi:uncharacterized protein with HEPN domain
MRRRRGLRLRLEHILKGIDRLERKTAGKTVEDYLQDEDLRDIVERNVARIAEAARHVPADARAEHPAVPWRLVVGIGNVIRHDYDEIDDLVMWETATQKLPPLKAAVENMLRAIQAEAKAWTWRGSAVIPTLRWRSLQHGGPDNETRPRSRGSIEDKSNRDLLSGRCLARAYVRVQPSARSITRWPYASTASRWPGLTIVTEAASSITAGPWIWWPARSSSRRWTGTSWRPAG